MKIGTGLAGLVAVGVAVGALWYFGRTRPIEIVERTSEQGGTAVCATCQGTRQATCGLCAGRGRVATGERSCPACEGTGKGKWQLKGSSGGRQMGSPPPCMQCRGTGRVGTMESCSLCSGTGSTDCPDCAGTGRQTATSTRKVRTVRAGPSLWERVLSWLFIAPDEDCAPQAGGDGSVPLVAAYVPLFEREGLSMRVVRWGGVSRGTQGWEVRATLRIRRGDTETDEGRIFVVRNREITAARPDAGP
ncbi:MAG: hypothetical protein FJ221_10870 [Lentisphaerae bacterium]|nr:hypothetical protein [Lentisphaerota bacterium]